MWRRPATARAGGPPAPNETSPPIRVRRSGWVLLVGVTLLLLAAVSAGLPPIPDDHEPECGERAALAIALRPEPDTSARCRELAIQDTALGAGMAALGIAMLAWGWARRRTAEEQLEVGEAASASVPRPSEVLSIPDVEEHGAPVDRVVVYPYTNAGILLASAGTLPFLLLQVARTLPPPNADVGGFFGVLWEVWFAGYFVALFGAAFWLWDWVAAELTRQPALVLDRYGITGADQPFTAWSNVADLTFGRGRTEGDDELEVAVLQLRLYPTDHHPVGSFVRYDLDGLSEEPEQIAAHARALHHRWAAWTPTGPSPQTPGDVRSAWRIAAVLVVTAALLVASTWLGLVVAGGWPEALDF